VYACGILLYELLTGTKPHRGRSPMEIVAKHINQDVPAPSALAAEVPPDLDALVARATARDPDARPGNAGRLLAQVDSVRAVLPPADELTTDLAAPAAPSLAATVLGGEIVRPQPLEATMVVPLEASAPPIYPDQRTSGGQRLGRGRGVFAFVMIALLAVAVGVGAWWIGAGRFTSAPNLVSLTYADASARATAAGLKARRGADGFSDTIAVGLVMATSPGPGDRIPKGGTITLTVSAGPERHPVPDLAGTPLDAARQSLASAKLTVGDVTRRFSDTVARDAVISSAPGPGVSLRPGTAVDLVVSRGPAPVRLPDVTGLPDAEALQRLRALGLSPDDTLHDFSATVPAGSVISSNPAPGAAVGRGSTVALTISQGPQLFPVPDVSGQAVAAAKALLEAQGFTVNVTRVPLGPGTVRSQDPAGGSMRPHGSAVHLFVF
jgi:serine/threonine-protein kinase